MVNERKLSKAELGKREDIIMKMKGNKRDLVKKYGKDAEAVMYGRATNMAKKKTTEMRNPQLTELIKDALKNPKAADLNKDGKLSSYEKTRGAAIEKNVSEDLDLGHEDNEPHMLKADLYHIGKCAMDLYNTLDQFDDAGEVDLPSWWQSKIFKAKEALVGAEQYLDFELNEPKIDAVVDVAVVDETVEDFITSVDDLDEGSKYSSLAEKLAKELKESVNEGMSKEALYSQIRDIIDSLDSGMSDGEPLTNETEMLLQQELHRLRKIFKSLKEGLPKGFWDKKIDAEDEDQDGKIDEGSSMRVTKQMWQRMSDDEKENALLTVFEDPDTAEKWIGREWDSLPGSVTRDMHTESINEDLRGLMAQGEKIAAFANKQSGYEGGVSSPVRGVLAAMAAAGAPDFDGDDEMVSYYTRKLTKAIEAQKGKKYMSGFSIDESYATVVNKIKKSGKSEKAAKAIAGAVASYKAKGGGKGPTAKQK